MAGLIFEAGVSEVEATASVTAPVKPAAELSFDEATSGPEKQQRLLVGPNERYSKPGAWLPTSGFWVASRKSVTALCKGTFHP